MRKAIKKFVASMMVAVVMVVAGACSSREKIVEEYDSIDEFVAKFGTTLEKVNPEDGCCLFDEGVIQSSVEEVLQCRIEVVWYKVYSTVYKDTFNRPYKYEYEGFEATYKLLDRQDVPIASLEVASSPATGKGLGIVAGNGKDKYVLIGQILVDNIEIEIYNPTEEQGKKTWISAFYTEKSYNTISLSISISISNEQIRENCTVNEFSLLIEPIIKSREILK